MYLRHQWSGTNSSMSQTLRFLICSYIIILISLASFVLVVNQTRSDTAGNANADLIQQLKKTELLQRLITITQMRKSLIQTTLRTSNNSIQQSFSTEYAQFTQSYNNTRVALITLLTPREKETMHESDRLQTSISEMDQQVILFFFDGSRTEAKKILQTEVLPQSAMLIRLLTESMGNIRVDLHNQLQMGQSQSESNHNLVSISALIAFVICSIVSLLSIIYVRKQSRQNHAYDSYVEEKVLEATESLLDTQRELVEDNTLLARLASTDSLTGLFNRSHINSELKKEHSRFQRHNQPFGIILLDIDHFKQVNDTYGHDVGDKVLVQLSKLLEKAVRNHDYASRWGGEEFLIACTAINDNDLLPIAETIRQRVSNTDFGLASDLTISLGCAIIQPNETIDQLVKRADVALYAAKNNGRNQTVVSEFVNIN